MSLNVTTISTRISKRYQRTIPRTNSTKDIHLDVSNLQLSFSTQRWYNTIILFGYTFLSHVSLNHFGVFFSTYSVVSPELRVLVHNFQLVFNVVAVVVVSH
jgi:hypothetical protein